MESSSHHCCDIRKLTVEGAEKATEIAVSFIKKHYFIAMPKKAVREGNFWIIEIDVGFVSPRIAKVKLDAETGNIIDYTVP